MSLFKIPNPYNKPSSSSSSSTATGTSDEMESLVKKMLLLIQMDDNFDKKNNEMHEQRLEKMKQLLEDSEKDDWMYSKIEDLIGL